MTGSVILGLFLLIIGILGFFVDRLPKVAYGVGALMILIQFTFNVTLGPGCECTATNTLLIVGYAIIAEVPATRVRTHTIVVGRTAYLLSQLVVNQLVPRMLTPDAWNWGARCGLFW